MMKPRLLALGVALTLLGACKSVGPDYHLPAQAMINQPKAQQAFVDTKGVKGIDTIAPVPSDWWKLYDDARLNQLIEQALHSNIGLRAATANLARAFALYDEALHAGGFDFGANATVERAEISAQSLLQQEKLPAFNIAVANLTASYEFDLFGKLKRGAEAAQADAQAGQAALDLARITVVAEVARSYMETCHANHELAIAEHSLQLQERSTQVAQRLYDAGRGTITDVTRAKAQADLIRASLPPLRSQKRASQYALSALLGRTPGDLPAGVDSCEDAPQLKQPIPVGDGMSLLARRPDIREAERKLAGATARIGIATADLYPDVKLGASVGSNGLLSDFNTAPSRQWSIGPLISWTVPSAGAHARVRATEAGADAALAQFDQTVLNALRDTQTALDSYAQRLDRLDALRQALNEARAAAAQDRTLYQGGRAPYLTSLDAERTLANAEASYAETEAQISLDQVNLFLALGGGWKQP